MSACQRAFSLLEIRFQRPWGIMHSAEEDNLSPIYSKIAFLCQSDIKNNKHVYHQSQVQKPTGRGVEWAECWLITGTGYWRYWFEGFSFILDSSVGLSAGIHSAVDLVPGTLGPNPAFSIWRQLVFFRFLFKNDHTWIWYKLLISYNMVILLVAISSILPSSSFMAASNR